MTDWIDRWRDRLNKLRFWLRCSGVGGVAASLGWRLLKRLSGLRVYRLALLAPSVKSTEPVPIGLGRYRFEVLSARELEPWAGEELELDRDFLADAAARGDLCHAVFDGPLLVNYCWCSLRPAPVEEAVYSRFPEGYAYRYKEFTRPSHRGQRLSAFNCSRALRLLRLSGVQGFVKFVEADNLISLHTQGRKGYVFVGWALALGWREDTRIWHSPGARLHAIGLQTSRRGPARPSDQRAGASA